MSQFATPKVFQANPSPLKKRVFLIVGVVGIAALGAALMGWGPVDQRAFYFAGGLTAVVFAIRFWSMQVWGGPTSLTFDADGVTLSNRTSKSSIPWAGLESITYQVSRSGHRWRFTPREGSEWLEFYLDGLTGRQRAELEETVKGIRIPNVKVVPFYDPFGLSADAA